MIAKMRRQGSSPYFPTKWTRFKKLLLGMICVLAIVMLFSSCDTLRAALYLSSIDELDGETLKGRELDVSEFLESILENPDSFYMKAYVRTGIAYQLKRNKLLTHSFFVIYEAEDSFYTLSFYGTKLAFSSGGVWVVNGDSDHQSYKMFLNGTNRWDVAEFDTGGEIGVIQTVGNILRHLKRDVGYYYQSHIIRREPYTDNCNTALHATMVVNRHR